MTHEIVERNTAKETETDTTRNIEKEQVEKSGLRVTKDKADQKGNSNIQETKQAGKKADPPKIIRAISSESQADVINGKDCDEWEKQIENRVTPAVSKSTSERLPTTQAKKVSPSTQDHLEDKNGSKAAKASATTTEILGNITNVQNKQQATEDSKKLLKSENTQPKSPQQRKRRKQIKSRLFQETLSFSAYKRATSEEQMKRRRRRELQAKQANLLAMKEAANRRKSMKRQRKDEKTGAAKKARKNGLSARPPFSTSPVRN